MQFSIGAATYRVRVTDKAIVYDGQPRRGLAVHSERAILISPDVPPEAREEVLRHEIRHVWGFHTPQPSTEEEDCQLHATISMAFQKDFEKGGGRNALLMMKPSDPLANPLTEIKPMPEPTTDYVESIRRVPVGVTRQSMPACSGARAYCAICGSPVVASAVITSEPRWDYRAQGTVRTMKFFCPVCDNVQTVTVGCKLGNEPDGQAIVNGPHAERGRAADDFLIEHPEASGVIVD